MAVQRKLEYFVLQYAPNALTDECINLGLVVLDPSLPETGFCVVRFAENWGKRVQFIDPEADLEILSASVLEFERRLCNPEQRAEMLRIMEDSFSNSIRVSSRKLCFYENAASAIEILATRNLQVSVAQDA